MFEKIVGHQKNKAILEKSIINEQVRHAYIFTGLNGVGKSFMAKEFAKILLCKEKNSPCNRCSSCMKMDSNNHPDFMEIFPDGASVKINQIRKMQHFISIKPYESKHRIFLIHDSDTMKLAAQNSLLKTLEEPNEYVVIILLVQNIQTLIPTIISRCERINFEPINVGLIKKYLIEEKNIDALKAEKVSNISRGSIGIAKKYLENEMTFNIKEKTIDYLKKILQGDTYSIFLAAEYFKEHKEYVEEMLEFIITWFRDIYILSNTGQEENIINQDDIGILKDFSYYLTDEKINDIMNRVIQAKRRLKYNVNIQLELESMLLKIQEE